MKLALAWEAIRTFAPLIIKSKKEEPEFKPVVEGGEVVRLEFKEPELVYSKKKMTSLASIITAILMYAAIHFGVLTEEQADLIDDLVEDKVEQVIEQ